MTKGELRPTLGIAVQEVELEVPLSKLKPWPRNYNKGDIQSIAESIRANGFYRAIVVQRSTGYVLAGNHSFMAAQQVGLASIPVAWIDVSDEEAARIAVADNLTARHAEIDSPALAELLNELKETELGLLGTGADEEFYKNLLDDLQGSSAIDGATDDEDVPDLPDELITISREGDIWCIGPHRVGCGSSLDSAHVGRLFQGRQADLVVTDPPYNVDYQGKTKDRLKIQNDAMSPEDFRQFIADAMATTYEFVREGGCIYVAYADTEVVSFREGLTGAGFKYSQTLIWVKHTAVMSRQDYNNRYEPIMYGWKGKNHYYCQDFKQTTVIDDEERLSVMSADEKLVLLQQILESGNIVRVKKPNRNAMHPTMKPVVLFQKFIANSSRPTELVYDPFGGSGTTLIAAHKTNRECITNDLDPRYVDVIVRRLQEFSGLKATRESDGAVFDDLMMERKAPA